MVQSMGDGGDFARREGRAADVVGAGGLDSAGVGKRTLVSLAPELASSTQGAAASPRGPVAAEPAGELPASLPASAPAQPEHALHSAGATPEPAPRHSLATLFGGPGASDRAGDGAAGALHAPVSDSAAGAPPAPARAIGDGLGSSRTASTLSSPAATPAAHAHAEGAQAGHGGELAAVGAGPPPHAAPVPGSVVAPAAAPHAQPARAAHDAPAGPAGAAPPVARFEGTPRAGAASDATRGLEAAVTAESAKLTLAYASKREAVQAAAAAQAAAIATTGVAEHAATVAAITEREQSVRAVFAAARANVAATQATQLALARGDVAAALQRMHGGSDGIVGQIRAGAHHEAERMRAAAREAAQSVHSSGSALRAEIVGYPMANLRGIVADLEPGELRTVEAALADAKRSAAGAVSSSDTEGAAKLHVAATENGHAFATAATNIIDQVNAKLPETEHTIHAAGAALETLIARMALSQLAGIDAAERQVLAQLATAKAHASGVVHAGETAAADLRKHASSQVAALTSQEATAYGQLHAAGAQAAAQLGAHPDVSRSQAQEFASHAAGALRQGNAQQLAALDRATAPVVAQLSGASATFAAVVHERRDQMLAHLDSAIGGAGRVLAQGLAELTQQCTTVRGEATSTYAAAQAQLTASAQPGLQTAQQTWKTKADEFVSSCRAYQGEALGKHAAARALLPIKMTAVVQDTVAYGRRSTARRIWDGIKSGLGAVAHGLVIFVAGVIVVAAVIVAFIGTAFLGLATVIALLVVGGVMLAVGLVTSLVSRFQMLWNNDWPWNAKIVGIPVAIGVAIGDVFGLSPSVIG
jgi:hypothetical protein